MIQTPLLSDSISIWHQGLVWNYLALEEEQQAYVHMQQACMLTPKDTQLIKGATLVAIGKLTEGITLLASFVDFYSSQNQSIMAAIFCIIAF